MSNQPGGFGLDLRAQLARAGDQVRTENEQQQQHPAPAQGDPAPEQPARTTKRKPSRRYDRMARIEGRLHVKQLQQLNALSLKLRDHRVGTGGDRERITNNTLLRVAVAVLLKHQAAIRGDTEAEMVESLLRHLSPEDTTP